VERRRRALITGIAGQDGSYLAELLVGKGYEVHGIVHGSPGEDLPRLDRVRGSVEIHWADLLDEGSIARVIRRSSPDEVYNLAAAAYVPASFCQPTLTGDVTGLGAVRMLQATAEEAPDARFFQASSGEIFGGSPEGEALDEHSPLAPRNPYGAAKAYAHSLVQYYRALWREGETAAETSARGLWCCSGISFNHESPRRGLGYVTRKITHAAAAISRGEPRRLELGTLDAVRDWGFARDYVEAMWLMLQQDEPEDYVLATGIGHTVEDVAAVAFQCVDRDHAEFVSVDPASKRPIDIDRLVGDPSRAMQRLGWRASKSFEEVIEEMVRHDQGLIDAGLVGAQPSAESELVRARP
jgi:GDPmannose 4,6-dehydratase